MGVPDQPDLGGRPGTRARRAAVVAWAACAAVVWNVVFDAMVIRSGREYLTLQALHQQGRAPAVTIRDIMDPGVARAAKTATLSGGGVGAAGLIAVWLTARRRAGRSAGLAQ
jgi:hypothetical protein